MASWLDQALYPDVEPPERLETLEAQIDFLTRCCAAWDFGILPEAATVAELRRPEWREPIDQAQYLTSLAYHVLRRWHGLPELPYLGTFPAEVRDDPQLRFV